MQLNQIDLNLLRLFDAIYQSRNVTRASEQLGMTQPATSQGLSRLRAMLMDPLFVRSPGGMEPTPTAHRLAEPVREALFTLERAFGESFVFDPATSRRSFRVHMSDIGESRFLPLLMTNLRKAAPGVRVETMPIPKHEIGDALDAGRIDMAFGFLPLREMQRVPLIRDRYIVLLRRGHPFLRVERSPRALLAALNELEFVAVRSHADTLRILEAAQLQDRLRLTTEHFLVLPSIVKSTDLVAIMPLNIALGFGNSFAIAEPEFPLRTFTVALHWSRRFDDDPGNRWLRELVIRLFKE